MQKLFYYEVFNKYTLYIYYCVITLFKLLVYCMLLL